MGINTRICSRCGDKKPTKDFTIHTECKNGRTYICYSCEKKRRSKYYGYEFGDIRRNTDYSLTIFKACPKCNFLLSIDYYGKDKNRADKHQSYCKECKKKHDAKDYKKHFNKRAESALKYYEENKDNILEYRKEYSGREDVKTRRREYSRNYAPDYIKKRKKVDIEFRILCNLRDRLRHTVKKKAGRTMDLVGLDIKDLLKYLESKFTKGMTLENYGEWHIDHKIPCVMFDLTDPEQQKTCFHYTNLQPLWAKDNLSKGAKLPQNSQLKILL